MNQLGLTAESMLIATRAAYHVLRAFHAVLPVLTVTSQRRPLLSEKKLRPREVSGLTQGHRANKEQF